jgi:hypothetical protein
MDESVHSNLEGNEDNENYSDLEYKSEREDFEEEDMTFEVLNNDRGGGAIWVNGTCKYLIYCNPKDMFYLRCADWKRLGCGARGICRKFNIWKKDVNTIHFLGRVPADELHNYMLSPEAFLD